MDSFDQQKRETFRIKTEEIVQKIKELVKEGNIRRIIIQNDEGRTLMEIPLTFAVVGVMLAPVLAAVGALAGILTNCTLIVERKE
ncbi:MAG TPA: DUF4342 domain-containing protein [Patescibacteria group bacterium]|nr:DUF4342 domain-containing protein [Patescibacteria group bacterium]